jgi:hypothetical protein
MPLAIFSIKGLSGNRRERIEAAVVAEASTHADPTKAGSR